MFRDCTPAVARALEVARLWAERLGASGIEPEHLLRGLIEEEEGQAALLLRGVGIELEAVRQTLVERAGGPWDRIPILSLPDRIGILSHRTESALASARQLAGEFAADRIIASEHLLLALLRQEEDLRCRLETLGLEYARLEKDVLTAQAPALRLEEPLCLADPTERVDVARILDAGTNRAREALRVLEDYCRFVLDDALLSGQLKQLRHDLAEALTAVPPNLLLEARETLRDVGTSLTTERERQRHSLRDVVQANLKRLQEALRSLEEFGKITSPRLGQALEQIRYRCYTLERALVLGATARQRLAPARLYVLISGAGCTAALNWTIREAAAGGATIFQLREKELDDRALLERSRQVRRWTREAGVLFIMNDRPDIARLVEADGVHLGQEELPVKEARRILGPDALIGVSTHNIDQVRQAVFDGASYLGVGPTFPSGTKHFPELAGLDFVRQATAETSLPAFVIGGMTLENVAAAVAAGARRVAVSQTICQADDPRTVAAEFCRILNSPVG